MSNFPVYGGHSNYGCGCLVVLLVAFLLLCQR